MPALLDDSLVIVLAGGAGERLHRLQEIGPSRPCIRRSLPHHRLRAEQLHQLGPAAHLHCYAVQVALPEPAYPHGVERGVGGARRIRRDSAASEAGGRTLYQGTADAVYQNLYSIMRENPRYLVVLSGDHVYKMDYSRMLRAHQERGAAVTLATIEVPLGEASRFGIVAIDEEERVTDLRKSRRGRRRSRDRRTSRSPPWASISSILRSSSERSKATQRRQPRTTSVRTSSRRSSIRRRSTRTASTTRTRRRRNTGAISGRSTRTSTPTWTCAR